MAENYFNISSFVDDLVPEHVATSYPELVEFIKVYALYLEHKNKSSFYLNQLDHQRDIDLIENELLTELQNEIGVPIPRNFAASPRVFYRHLVEFYKSRGTPESITAFFRLIYDDNVEVYYPKVDMLIPSDGKWYDLSDGIKADPASHTPAYTFTISAISNIVEGADDIGFKLDIENDVVFVNDVLVETGDWRGGFYVANDEWVSYIKFDVPLAIGDVVHVYKAGLFTTADGFASDKKYIQDSFFYQKFSYVLKTGKSIDDWKSAFTRLVHPSGFIFFGEILIFIEMLTSANNETQPGYQASGLPRNLYIDMVSSNPHAIALQEIIKTWTDFNGDVFTEIRTFSKYTWNLDQGTYVEKELMHDFDVVTKFGFRDHFDNTKFVNYRSIRDYSKLTIEDVINKTIRRTQLGCAITQTTI
jgi:hypothetical protein